MKLIEPYIESFLCQLKYSTSTHSCKGIITFDEIKNEFQRERVTSQMIEEFKSQVERRGIDVEVDDNNRVVYITVNDAMRLVLTPAQMRLKNEAIEYYLRNYGNV